MEKINKSDVILILSIFLISAMMLVIFLLYKNGSDGELVLEVSVDGEIYGRYPLDTDRTINIGETNICTISGGYVSMTDAECPDKSCMKMKSISKAGETIVCLPNRVVLKIVGKERSEVDVVVGCGTEAIVLL